MEVEEMDRDKVEVGIPWIPNTPIKLSGPKPAPICTAAEENHLGHRANEAVACGEEKDKRVTCDDVSVPVTEVAGESGKTGEQTGSDDVFSGWRNFVSSEFSFPAETASADSCATPSGNNNGLNNSQDLQETSDNACCSTALTPDDSMKAESREPASTQVNMEGKEAGKEEENVPAKKLDNDGAPPNEGLNDSVIEFSAVSSSLKENHDLDKGSGQITDLNQTPAQKPKRRKHRPKVIVEGKPKRPRKPATPKPVQPKVNSTGKRKYVRKTALNKTSTPPTEVTGEFAKEVPESPKSSCRRSLNFDVETRDESCAGGENTTAGLNVGAACDSNASIKQASTGKRKYVRKTGLNKTSTPPAEVTGEVAKEMPESPKTSCRTSVNFDTEAKDESCAGGENTTEVLNADVACDSNASIKQASTGKRKYVRKTALNKTSTPPAEVTGEVAKKVPESPKMFCRTFVNFDTEAKDESCAGGENTTEVLNVDLAYDSNASIKQASTGCMSLPEDTQAPIASPSRRTSPGAKPTEKTTSKRKYVRKKGLNKTSAPATETLAREESSTVKENATEHLGSVVTQEMSANLAYELNISLEQASNMYKLLAEGTDATNTSSGRNPREAKPKENPTAKRKRVRSGLKKSSTPTEATGELIKEMVPKSSKTCRKSLNFDKGDGSSADKENVKRKYVRRKGLDKSPTPTVMAGEMTEPMMTESKNLDVGNEKYVVVEETPVGVAYTEDAWMSLALNNCMSLPGDKLALSTSPSESDPPGEKTREGPACKRTYVRRKGLNKPPTPTVTTGELTEPVMPGTTIISCRSPAHDKNTLVNDALYNYMSLPEDSQAVSTSLSKSNPLEASLNANSQDGNISSAQISTIRSQMVGSKRKQPGTIKCADNSGMNLTGAHYNGLPSYQSKFWVEFPNIQRKRRTGKGKTSDTHITSSVTPEKELQLTYTQEDAQEHPYASNSSCWIYGSGYNAAIIPGISASTENVIGNTQMNDEYHEYLLSLRRLTERSRFSTQTWDCNSLMGITNCVSEQNYTAKRLGISDWLTFGVADRPQTCINALVAEKEVSLAKKKRNIKKGAPSSSAYPSTNEMQQNDNLALTNHFLPFLPLGKSSDVAPVKRNRKKEAPSSSAYPSTNEMQQNHNLELTTHFLPLEKSSDVAPVKRNRKKGNPSSSAYPSTSEILQNYNLALTNHFLPLGKSSDVDIEALAEQFRQLNISTDQHALVPFQGSFIKKHHPRPKVDLDEETDKVWKLLMLDINSHGVDGTDEDKAKWWEEERNVFRGRADSFIARMHLVQGDRRFSRWKGSVVDSVVGVFLTQNVSDHLSSSAYMSLAARFPPKPSSMRKTCHGEGTSLEVNEPQVQIVEPEENTECDVKLLNQSLHDQSFTTIDIAKHSGEKEAVESNDSCRITSSVTDESNCRLPDSSQRNIKEHQSPMRSGLISTSIEELEDKSCYDSAGLESNVVSSQCSVISSQISGDFSNDQNPEKIGSSSDSNSEIEDLSSTAMYNSVYSGTSFSKLLEIVSSTKFHEVNSEKGPTEPNTAQIALGHSQTIASQVYPQEQSSHMQQSFFNISEQTQDLVNKERGLDLGDHKDTARSETNEISSTPITLKSKGQGKEKQEEVDWDSLRLTAQAKAGKRERTENTMDTLDWDAVRCADVNEIANTIKERGMNNRLAERIQGFLNRLVEKHGSIDLEWLRDVPPDQAKEYLLSFRGLGLKSVECVRLLTLHHLAFPVDTNVGRIAVRLGWVPLQPLPESLQLHLLEMYPVLESIQKYLWPRLCKLDQRTLYELHYQMITFGKVFCTKSKPNCNACPMRAECRHFASAFASARLALPGPEQKSIVTTAGNSATDQNPSVLINQLRLPLPENTTQAEEIHQTEVSRQLQLKSEINICQPIIEEPTSPEPECSQVYLSDIEDAFNEDSCEIPTIKLNIEEFTLNLQNYIQQNMELQEGEMSKALVALDPQAASIPMPKLKNVSRLRTEHCVYELPDTHPLLEGWDVREPDDPGKYLLAIWTPGETANSIQPPENKCSSQEECGQLCSEKECFSCNSFREANSQIVRGTILIPCRTAMQGSFPLNGTYFQVNEVFADHDSSHEPISVPRSWLWNLNRRTVYFGTSIPTIFKGLSTQDIQQCFWRGYVCVRGFDRISRAPRPLMARLHMPASKLPKPQPKEKPKKEPKQKTKKESSSAKGQGPEPNPKLPELVSSSHDLQNRKTA